MEEKLKKVYKKFISFDKKCFLFYSKKLESTLKRLRVSDRIIKEFYDNYYRPSLLEFLRAIKDIYYSGNVFEFISTNSLEDWDLWKYLEFLRKEKIVKIRRNGTVEILKRRLLEPIPKPQTEKEIEKKLEMKLKTEIQPKRFVTDLFRKFKNFEVKAKWDQMPISQESAIFLAKKMLGYLPLNKRLLFVGDDDFISVILSLVDPSIESLVVDIDDQLLECISFLSRKFNLKIETQKADIQKARFLGEKFVGFLTNPIYTFDGIKTFMEYGIKHLREDGGIAFLEMGDESIGKRILNLQDFFVKNNLILQELITNKIYYPHIIIYPEDKEINRRLVSLINEEVIQKSPRLGASLFVFLRIPVKPKAVRFKKPIYAYL